MRKIILLIVSILLLLNLVAITFTLNSILDQKTETKILDFQAREVSYSGAGYSSNYGSTPETVITTYGGGNCKD